MPVVDVDPDELRRLIGDEDKDDDHLRSDLFNLGLEFEGFTEDDEFQLEFAPDRLDRLSVEGVARSLRYQYGDDRGVYTPDTNGAEWVVDVEDTPPERPYVTTAIVRGLDMDEAALDSLIQLQEKLHATMGRQRAKGAIGIHDLTMLKGGAAPDETSGKSVTYTGIEPDGDTFVPLEGDREMTPRDVIEGHHIGKEYADLVEGLDRVPAIYDSIGLFSFPPVVNGRRTEVETDSRDLFIEMTGTDQWTIDHMLNIVCYALDARGGQVEEVRVEYSSDAPGEYAGQQFVRPDLATKTKSLTHDRIEQILGVEMDPEEVIDCAARSGLDARGSEDEETGAVSYDVDIPPYRVDVLHPLDVIDDVGRAYGFNTLEPSYPEVSTVGGRHERSRLEDAARDALVGLGFEDLLNFHMINEAENYDRMGLAPKGAAENVNGDNREQDVDSGMDVLGAGNPVTIQEPYSEDYTMLRTWALPSILMVLENNTHRGYPQDLAEIGLAAEIDESENTGGRESSDSRAHRISTKSGDVAEHRTVAGALAHTDASYEDAKARLQTLAKTFGKDLETPPTEHPTFISGRAAEVVLDGQSAGIIGEIHPKVLVEHDLELPVAAFEFRLDALE